ncbi:MULTISPECIES: recombinase family protein [Niallia]|uniref:recombinase family protein n=1 Tax=Niallia TaxID=2837506 RepID=UPI0030FC6E87
MIGIYARVSTEEQLKGFSINGQIEECIQLAGNEEYLKYVDEGITGEIMNRPALTRLQDDIEKGLIHKVICYDPDRLSRKLLVQLMITETLQKNNVELQFVRSDYKNDAEGQLYFQVRGAFSEFDKAKIKHNTMTGRYRKAKSGKVVKNNHLYGYHYNKEKETYEINEEEAKVVRMIFDYYTNPNSKFQGINGIALHLTDISIPTKRGAKVWHRQVVRQILMNEAYTGNYYQNKYDTVGNYVKKQAGEKVEYGKIRPEEEWLKTEIPAIISLEQFEYAQSLLEQGRRRQTKVSFHHYLLSGLVRCDRCGGTMTGKKTKSHGKDFFIYTCRKNYAGSKSKGCGKQISENKLNKYVWDTIVDLLSDPKKIAEFREQDEKTYLKEEMEYVLAEIEKAKKGRKRLFQLVSLSEDDDMDLEEIKEQIRNLQLKEKKLQDKYNEMLNENEVAAGKEPSVVALESAINMFMKNKKNEFSFEHKQEILRRVIKEVMVVDSETINIQIF